MSIATAALVLLSVSVVFHLGQIFQPSRHVDFTAFYCAGHAIRIGADPYLVEPLRSCEHAINPSILPKVAVPAPLPGYSLEFFAVLSRFPYALADTLFGLAICASLALTAACLSRIAKLPFTVAFGCMLLSVGLLDVNLGQIVPFALLAICGAAYFLRAGRPIASALCAAGGMIEPNVGLAACLALFVFERKTRVTLMASALIFGCLSLFATGVHGNVEYLLAVLPAHANSEILNHDQFSLVYLAHGLGLPDAIALKAGAASYVGMLLLGLALGKSLAFRLGEKSFLIFAPVSTILLGGAFMHIQQMALALPLAMVLLPYVPGARLSCKTCIVLFAVPWAAFPALGNFSWDLGAVEIVVAALTMYFFRTSLVTALSVLLSATFLCICRSAILSDPEQPNPGPITVSGRALAEATWKPVMDALGTYPPWPYVLAKVPTLVATFLLIGLAVRAATNSPQAGPYRT